MKKFIRTLKKDIPLTVLITLFIVSMIMLFVYGSGSSAEVALTNTKAYVSIGDEVLELDVKHIPRRGSSLITIETMDGKIYTTSNVNVVIVEGE